VDGGAFDQLARPGDLAVRRVERDKRALVRPHLDEFGAAGRDDHRSRANIQVALVLGVKTRLPLACSGQRIEGDDAVVRVADAGEGDAAGIDGGRRPHAVARSAARAQAARPAQATGLCVKRHELAPDEWLIAERRRDADDHQVAINDGRRPERRVGRPRPIPQGTSIRGRQRDQVARERARVDAARGDGGRVGDRAQAAPHPDAPARAFVEGGELTAGAAGEHHASGDRRRSVDGALEVRAPRKA